MKDTDPRPRLQAAIEDGLSRFIQDWGAWVVAVLIVLAALFGSAASLRGL